MAKKVGLPQVDHQALVRCVALYKKLSRPHSVELSAMILKDGWRHGAEFAARRLQAISLGLKPTELSPCELYPQRIGGLTELWLADPRGIDERRAETATILKQLLFYGLSRYEPRPLQAIDAAEERRRELPATTGPTTDDAA